MPQIIWHNDPNTPNAGNAFGTAMIARNDYDAGLARQDQQIQQRMAQADYLAGLSQEGQNYRTGLSQHGQDQRASANRAAQYTRDNENRASREHLAALAAESRVEQQNAKARSAWDMLKESLGWKADQADKNRALTGRGLDIREAGQGFMQDATQRKIDEQIRANQAREAQARANADALAGDRANRGAVKMSVPDDLEYKQLKKRYDDLMVQGDKLRAGTGDEDAGKAHSLYAGARLIREQMQQLAAKYARPQAQPAPLPAAVPLPPAPAPQPVGDVDPNQIHAAAAKLMQQNPTWTDEQVYAEIRRMLGGG